MTRKSVKEIERKVILRYRHLLIDCVCLIVHEGHEGWDDNGANDWKH